MRGRPDEIERVAAIPYPRSPGDRAEAGIAFGTAADAVAFTGGIGENAPEARARIGAGLEWMELGGG